MQIVSIGTRVCLCRACGRHFTSPSAFDDHRVGTFGSDRRCATDRELRRTLERDERGVWRRAVEPPVPVPRPRRERAR